MTLNDKQVKKRKPVPVGSSIPEEERALQSALRMLGYRARSEAELRQRLGVKGYSDAGIAQTLATLKRLGYVDDEDFARGWVTARTGYGPIRLKQELQQKGISRPLAESVVSTGISAEEEYASARQIAQRALRSVEMPPNQAHLLRVRRLLQRRGFSFEVITRVCAGLTDCLTAEGDWLE